MEITEEQRKRAEANRLAALEKRKALSSIREDAFRLYKCQKPNALPKPPERFQVRLEICSPDSFAITPEPLQNFSYPGEAECLRRLGDFLAFVMPSHYTQNHSGGKASVYKLGDYEMVLKCLKKSKGIELQEIPYTTLSVMQKFLDYCVPGRWIPCMPEHLSDDEVDGLIAKLPRVLYDALLPFQVDGVRFGLRRGGRCLIADEMGLGKTLQAIAIACCFIDEGPILVVCPAILRFSWAEELERWLPFFSPTDIHLVFGHQDNPVRLQRFPRIVVISYRMLNILRKSILEQEWSLLIIDESHHLRSSKKTPEPYEIQAALDVAMKVKRNVLLSGTPSLSRPFDIFNQINILWPCLLGKDKYDFAKKYCAVKSRYDPQGKIFQDYSQGIRLEELNVLLKQTVMIRRLKEHLLLQLPPKRRQVIRLKLSRTDIDSAFVATRRDNISSTEIDQQNDPVNDCTSETDDEEEEPPEISSDYSDKKDRHKSSRLLSNQQLGIAKLSGFREWLSIHPIVAESGSSTDIDVNIGSQKMLIFSHHLKVLDGVQEIVCEKGIGFVRIDGHTLARDRQSAVQAFRTSAEVKVAIIGITAGGVGLDFSSARNVIFLELPITSSDMLQAEDRAHRRGQTNAVNIYIFCAKNTSDESHWKNLNKTLCRVSSVMNGKYDSVQEIEVHKFSDLDFESDVARFDYLDGNDAEDLYTRSCTNLVSEVTSENGSSENHNCNELFKVDHSISRETAVSWARQPVGMNEDASEKTKFTLNKCAKDDRNSSKQSRSPTVEGGSSLSVVNIVEVLDDSFSIRGVQPISEAMHTGILETNFVCKMDNTTVKVDGLEAIAVEGISDRSAETTIFECTKVQEQMEASKLHKETSESDEDEPAELANADECYSLQAGDLRFEISQYTGRIHLYTCIPEKDSRPRLLCKNFRPEEIDSLNFSSADINKKTDGKFMMENEACQNILQAFMKEWNGLRPVDQKKLLGKPLQLPLTSELWYLKESINHGSEGLLKGGSKQRTTPLSEISQPLPANASWKKISLCRGRKKEKEYTQGWTVTGEPLCKLCQKPCKGKLSKIPEYFEDLFCEMACFQEYRVRTSQGSLREELFKMEHGVCVACKLDCHELVNYIRPLKSVARRREHVEKVAPNVARSKKLLDKLINYPREGNAWHADHIIPVYRGGGECNLDNMRTLCVACHSDVTKAQSKERRLRNKRAKDRVRDILKGLKVGSSMEHANHNSKEQGDMETRDKEDEDELLMVDVPGSDYSRATDTVTVNKGEN
ncbi:hypothetical protein MKW98_017604 [Papaver atlanticum]|uniref:DNA annealing helicase and endonuclease ZRANB3 n=1 Tax=Papaver atlanticum TaxID=357466 RepID=A0AAD4XV10_9MAGN|nr:hypothetical protein MKW98_017604 [Papaver atlanticum]